MQFEVVFRILKLGLSSLKLAEDCLCEGIILVEEDESQRRASPQVFIQGLCLDNSKLPGEWKWKACNSQNTRGRALESNLSAGSVHWYKIVEDEVGCVVQVC
ncbi:uncharacterized protein LOC126802820 isoform X2 [Argentina anserina]|uniref:uncharacterized protein LOC126802820 isoform X2 n=1 Tax=Argentina anserina TaxID=57926 RepID=UPI002176503D|nr:uncharacterized protein LOC126802820 isoform X2 [Potentilla anserina]